jgi:lysyl-tRNA synthetase class 2
MNVKSPQLSLAEMTRSLRTTLWSRGFVELPTALIHEHDACPIFQRVELKDGRFLRESGGLALRCNLEHHEKIFEIAQCVRNDGVDNTHLQQFTMLDLYQADATLEHAIELCKELFSMFYSGPTKYLSVAEHIRFDLGVDLISDTESEGKLQEILSKKYSEASPSLIGLVNRYITLEIEPLSRGCLLIVTDIPRIAESAGRQRPDAVGIARIAEFQVDGIEVAQLIEDESDPDSYLKRAKAQGHYGPEVEAVVSCLKAGRFSRQSAGFGIGLERLAMVSLGCRDIRVFMPSVDFVREIKR